MLLKKGTLLKDNITNPIISEARVILDESGFSTDNIEYYTERLIDILDDYARRFGSDKEIEYVIRKRRLNLEVRLVIPGKKYDPFENGRGAKKRKIEKLLNLNIRTDKASISHFYIRKCNVIAASVPLYHRKKKILNNPVILACILGVITGIICSHLPQNANDFIVNDMLNPAMSTMLKVFSGIMGPVIFISLVTSIIALDSINELTDLGFKIFRRFFRITLFFIAVSIGISLLFFRDFGTKSFDFSPGQIFSLLLDIIPVNAVSPLLENKTPQLVVLAFLSGISLLLLGDKVRELKKILFQINDWVMSILKLVLYALPCIPFLSIATTIARRDYSVLTDGWKYIAATYVVCTILFLVKLARTSVSTKIPARDLVRKVRPLMRIAFTTHSTSASIRQAYKTSKEEFDIKPGFTSFWIPMCTAMLSAKSTVALVLATMMTAQLTGISVSLSFLCVLVILVLELSLASPGTTAGWLILFESFSMPASYVGLFSAYRLFTENYATAVDIAYDLFEEVEAAYKMDEIEKSGQTDQQEHKQIQ